MRPLLFNWKRFYRGYGLIVHDNIGPQGIFSFVTEIQNYCFGLNAVLRVAVGEENPDAVYAALFFSEGEAILGFEFGL